LLPSDDQYSDVVGRHTLSSHAFDILAFSDDTLDRQSGKS
jgi:hypothetical protein